MFPKLIVFDFHGVLSLLQNYHDNENIGINDLKKNIKLVNHNWFESFQQCNLESVDLVPCINDLIKFCEYINNLNQSIVLAVASMCESEEFIFELMKYVFSKKGYKSPFIRETIVTNQSFIKYKDIIKENKLKHIDIIMRNINKNFLSSEIVLIDDDIGNLHICQNSGILTVEIECYFTINEWNKSLPNYLIC